MVCFLSYNLPNEISVKIWDLFLISGIKVIFKFALALLQMMKRDLMKSTDFGNFIFTYNRNV